MQPKTKKLLIGLGIAVCLIATLLEVAIHDHHLDDPNWKTYWWSGVPFFFGALGFAGCWVIVIVSKWLGHVWLQRPEGHYGEEEPGE